MHFFRTYISRFFLGAALLLVSVSAANAALIKSYDFNGDLTDTLGNGNDLVASGGLVSNGRYTFDHNQGLRLTSALLDETTYGIEIRLYADDTGADHKVIDFQDLTSDFGLYIDDGGINFFNLPPVGAKGSVREGENHEFTLGLSRSGGFIQLFLDGILLVKALDTDQAISRGNVLNFFVDDLKFGQLESFSGSADFIRIHEDSTTFGTSPISPVPVPAALWLFGTALIGLIGFGKRKAKT